MSGVRRCSLAAIVTGLCCACLPLAVHGKDVEIASLRELAHYAGQSGNAVTMKPGVYRMIDFIPIASLAERRQRNELAYLTFSGNDNVFTLAGVTIEFDTALRRAPSAHSYR